MPIFAVIRRWTDKWDHGLDIEGQPDWRAHADYMDGLEAEGFCRLAGPLGDGRDEVLLIFDADSAGAIERRLEADPWTAMGLLETVRIAPWNLRLGALF